MAVTSPFLSQDSCSPLKFVFVAFAAVAIWSTIPLTIRLLTTLKRRSGVYFYSILITSWGLSIRQIGFCTQFFAPRCPWIFSLILSQSGWVAMVTGFSMVLYSRLNIILESRGTRRAVLCMIVFNGVVWHITMAVLSAGIARARRTGRVHQIPEWQRAMDPMERVQIVMFSAQEMIISFFYVRAAYQYLKSRFAQKDKTRSAMFLLLLVQVIIIAVDVALIVIDFAGYLQLKLFIHSFVYAVKLELEFVVLNQLVELSRMGVPGIPSFSFAAAGRDNEVEKGATKKPEVTVQQLPQQNPADLDLELSESKSSKGTLDFITRPSDVEMR